MNNTDRDSKKYISMKQQFCATVGLNRGKAGFLVDNESQPVAARLVHEHTHPLI